MNSSGTLNRAIAITAPAPESVRASGESSGVSFQEVLRDSIRDVDRLQTDAETAIKKMTSMPADQLGLRDRGRLRIGHAADIVVLNFDDILDRATFSAPHQYPKGIDSVLVNGTLVINSGRHLETRPGRILPPQRPRPN